MSLPGLHPHARPSSRPGARLRVIALGAAFVLVALVAFHPKISRKMPDFEVYRTAGTRIVAAEPLYRASDGHWQFKYLPAFAFLAVPFSIVPAPIAHAAWFVISVALLIAMIVLSLRLLPSGVASPVPARRGSPGVAALVGVTILAMGKFYAHELGLGQTNILLAVVVLLGVAAWRAGRSGTAGAWLAAATIVKPYAIVFLPYLVVRRRWREAACFVVVLGTALLVPSLLYGLRGNAGQLAGWWQVVTGSTPANLAVSDNISIAGMYAKWFGIGLASRWLAVATALIVVGACARVLLLPRTAEFPEYLDAALLLTLIPLLSPQGWDYVLLVATPAVMLLVTRMRTLDRSTRWLAAAALLVPGLTIFDVVGRRFYALFMLSSAVSICYLYVVTLLLRLRCRQLA